jgi:hypothetical protein
LNLTQKVQWVISTRKNKKNETNHFKTFSKKKKSKKMKTNHKMLKKYKRKIKKKCRIENKPRKFHLESGR